MSESARNRGQSRLSASKTAGVAPSFRGLPIFFGPTARPSADLDGVPIHVASIAHLIALKRLANRPLDMDDIKALQEIAAEQGQKLP